MLVRHRRSPEETKFLLTFVCGHTRQTHFVYDVNESKWDAAFCNECHKVRDVTEMAPAYNSKEVELNTLRALEGTVKRLIEEMIS